MRSRSRPASILLAAVAALSALTGCKEATTYQELKLAREVLKEQRELEIAASAQKEEEDRKIGEASLKEEKLGEAERAIVQGKYEEALAVIDDVTTRQRWSKTRDKESGKEQSIPIGPVPLLPAEESRFLSLKGTALYALGRSREALPAYQQALEKDPSNRDARRSLGRIHFAEARYPEALEAWMPELADGYRDAELLFLVAQARYALGVATNDPAQVESARLAMQSVLLEKPRDPEALRWLANIEFDGGRYGEAMRYLEILRKDNPLDPEYLELLAACHLKLGDRKRALDYYGLSSRLRLPAPETCRTIGELYAGAGLPGRAAEWLGRGWKDDPKAATPEDRLRIGNLLLEAGRYEEAGPWLEAIAEGEPGHADALAAQVKVFGLLGKGGEALAAYESLRKQRPGDAAAHLAAGRLYLERKGFRQAIDAFSRASALPGSEADGLAGIGEATRMAGDVEGAVAWYRKALQERPGDARIAGILRSLLEEVRSTREDVVAVPVEGNG